MKNLLSLKQSSLCTTASLSPLKPKVPIFLQPRRTCKVLAKAKGFGGASNDIQEKETAQLDSVSKTSPQNPHENAQENVDDDKIPEVVLNRMIVRILVFVGVPLVTGMATLRGFTVAQEQNLVDIPLWLPYLTLFLMFGTSTLGIAIGSLSASWDPDRKGSFLGLEEAQRNWVEMWKEKDENYK